jgi:hypothetical protein
MTKSPIFYGSGGRFLSRTAAARDRHCVFDLWRTKAGPRAAVSQDTVSWDTVSQAARVRAR